MSVKRYAAATSREALAKVRMDLGPDAVILANRKTPNGVEVTAVPAGELDRMVDTPPKAKPTTAAVATSGDAPRSFKEFVAQAYGNEAPAAAPVRKPAASAPAPKAAAPAPRPEPQLVIAEPAPVARPAPVAAEPRNNERLEAEISALKRSLDKRLSELAWSQVAARHPLRAQLGDTMIEAGFSRDLSRHVTDALDPAMEAPAANTWLESVITRNIACANGHDLVETGGVFALVGPTGAGKTTTVAKLAARAVVRFGAAKVALIAADGFRIGAQEQLRTYAQILGVPLYAASDRDSLERALEVLKDRHLVIIDTAGLGPRDARLADQSRLLDLPRVKKILMLAANAQPESLERSVRAYAGAVAHGAILTKLDEAVKLGAVLDTVLRNRLTLHFVANGQRVPEDLHPAHARLLAHRALHAEAEDAPAPWRSAA